MSYVINGEWSLDLTGEYQLDDVIVIYDRSNDSINEFTSLQRTPVDLNVFVSSLYADLSLRRSIDRINMSFYRMSVIHSSLEIV